MRLAGVGDNVVDRYPDLGLMFPGGQALNVAVHARRAGIESAYVGVLGDDEAGRVVLEALRVEGVDVTRTRVVRGANAWADIELIDGDRRFAASSDGVAPFRLDADDLEFLRGCDILHTSESSLLEEQLPLLAATGRPISYDFSERRDPAYLDPLLPHVAIAAFSLADLGEDEARAWMTSIHARGPQLVLATRGRHGALLYDGQRFLLQPVAPTEVVDTLGAGDAFLARLLVGVLRAEPLDRALSEAAVTAAATCRSYGAFGHGTPYPASELRPAS